MTTQTNELLKAAAQTLQEMAGQVEQLGDELLIDPNLADRHMGSLQSLDLWTQQLVQIANVISADDPIEAAEDVTLSDLRDHLRKAA